MKQKYSITVADMQMNIVSDASPEEVENLVGILDRRMRDINLKSPRCTKNEAAILCALSYCSERLAVQEAYRKVEQDSNRHAAESEALRKLLAQLREEMDVLKRENAALKLDLDYLNESKKQLEEQLTASREESAPSEESAPAVQSEQPGEEGEEPAMTAEPEQKPEETERESPVTMFDLFHDA